jgi:hypothetical protein
LAFDKLQQAKDRRRVERSELSRKWSGVEKMILPFLVGKFIAKRKRDRMLIIESLNSLDRR